MTSNIVASGSLSAHQHRAEKPWVITIDMHPDSGEITVLRRRFNVEYEPGDVQDINRRFSQILEQIRGEIHLKDNKYNDYLAQLRDVGSEAYALLPEKVGDYILELESDAGDRGISLDFTFPSDMALLWEMMYIGDPTEPTDLQKFWGFRYPIGHLYWESDVRPTVALHEGVYTLSHDSLIHTKQELESLKHKLETLREQFIAAVCYLEEDTTLICEAMDVEMLMRHFNSQIFRYGVVHFACHCDNAEGAGASQAYLSVTAHQQEVMITLGKLNALARHRRGFRYRPLVFLNACESATPLHLLQSLNFPSSLLKFGAGGVIATNCVMPDNFASAFATKFYETLLNKPLNASPAYIGETLLETRKHFAETYRNPLGLAYGLYAVSDQEFRLLG